MKTETTNSTQDSLFKTPNTALAAYLFSLGYTLIEVDSTQYPSIFVFQSDDSLEKATHVFEIGRAEGNILLFFRAYKNLLGKVKAGQP